jgi:hypothetical protein
MTRQLLKLATLPIALVVAGCNHGSAVTLDGEAAGDSDLVAAPPRMDEAIDLRDWPVTLATYENGDTIAGSRAFLFETNPEGTGQQPLNADGTRPEGQGRAEAGEAVLEPLVFLANVITLPVGIFMPPPGEAVRSEGMELPPSYTLVPPVPPAATPSTRPAFEPIAPATRPATPNTRPVLEMRQVPAGPDVEPRRETVRPPVTPTTRPMLNK